MKEMKLPTLEGSLLQQESLKTSSTTKIVDCILALKAYYEWTQSEGNGFWKYVGPLRTPMVPQKMGNFLQLQTPCVLLKDLEALPNSLVKNMDETLKTIDDIFQSKVSISIYGIY